MLCFSFGNVDQSFDARASGIGPETKKPRPSRDVRPERGNLNKGDSREPLGTERIGRRDYLGPTISAMAPI